MAKKVDDGLALVRTVVERNKVEAEINRIFWGGLLTLQANAKFKALKRRREQLDRRIMRILHTAAKRKGT